MQKYKGKTTHFKHNFYWKDLGRTMQYNNIIIDTPENPLRELIIKETLLYDKSDKYGGKFENKMQIIDNLSDDNIESLKDNITKLNLNIVKQVLFKIFENNIEIYKNNIKRLKHIIYNFYDQNEMTEICKEIIKKYRTIEDLENIIDEYEMHYENNLYIKKFKNKETNLPVYDLLNEQNDKIPGKKTKVLNNSIIPLYITNITDKFEIYNCDILPKSEHFGDYIIFQFPDLQNEFDIELLKIYNYLLKKKNIREIVNGVNRKLLEEKIDKIEKYEYIYKSPETYNIKLNPLNLFYLIVIKKN
jgi:hypothetical protein